MFTFLLSVGSVDLEDAGAGHQKVYRHLAAPPCGLVEAFLPPLPTCGSFSHAAFQVGFANHLIAFCAYLS